MVMKFKIKTFLVLCILITLIVGAGIVFGVIEFKEFQRPEEILVRDLSDYLMISYFYATGDVVLILNPTVSYYDEDSGSEVVLTEEKIYCIKNWDYKIFYSKPDLPKNEEQNKKF